jgi:hypothetical protein
MLQQGKAWLRGRAIQRLLIQSVLEDGFYVFIGVGLNEQSSGTGSFETFGSISFFQAQDA